MGLHYILVAKLTQKVSMHCRHDEAHWQATEVPSISVQEVELDRPGRRLIVVRQRVQERPQAGGKRGLESEGYRFEALVTNLPRSVGALAVWRRCRIATEPNVAEGQPHELSGRQFARATEGAVRRAVSVLEPPRVSNLLAIEAPAYGSGRHTRQQIELILQTAFSGFVAARVESADVVGGQVLGVLHTGFWGCGASGGHRTLMTMLQIVAGGLARVSQLIFHAVDLAGGKLAEEARRRLSAVVLDAGQPMALHEVIQRIWALGLHWGVSDGNGRSDARLLVGIGGLMDQIEAGG